MLENSIDINKDNIIKNDSERLICIESPLFDLVSKMKNFENNFSIYISQNHIDKYVLKTNYTNFFDKINKSDLNYSSIYYFFNNKSSIRYLKDFHIDFNKIKKISLIEEENEENDFDEDFLFFETLFSLDNIINNLIYLKIHFKPTKFYKINNQLAESLNNLKSLKYLYLHKLNFDNNFRITLSNLIILNLKENEIKDLKIIENADLKELKELDLSYNNISDINLLGKIKLGKLEKLNLEWNEISSGLDILESTNFKNLKELNLSQTNTSDIRILEKVSFGKIEKLNLAFNQISNINVLEKVYFPELKELDLSHNKISDIRVFENVKFGELELLNLAWNKKFNINILEVPKFKLIKIKL